MFEVSLPKVPCPIRAGLPRQSSVVADAYLPLNVGYAVAYSHLAIAFGRLHDVEEPAVVAVINAMIA